MPPLQGSSRCWDVVLSPASWKRWRTSAYRLGPRQVGRSARRGGSDDGGFSFNPSGKDDDDDRGSTTRCLRELPGIEAPDRHLLAGRGATAASMGREPGTMGQARPRYFEDDIGKPANNSPAAIGEAQR